jgi:hypothetical protein
MPGGLEKRFWIVSSLISNISFEYLDLLHLGGAHLAVGAGRWVRGKNSSFILIKGIGDGELMMDEFARSKEGRWI